MEKQTRRILFLAGAVLLPVMWLFVCRLLVFGSAENSLDVFYHIRIASEGPGVFLAREFPALQLSVWCDTFADKEMLFHFLLWLLTGVRKIFCGEIAPPFHFEYLFFLLLMSGAFVFAARQGGVRARTIFAGCLLPLLLTAGACTRLTMLRPHLLSVALLLIAFGLLAKGTWKQRSLWMLLLSFIYAWSYSNPHFIAIPALVYAVFEWREHKFRAFLPVLTALCGVLLGLLIHPQSPNSFLIWKVQSLDALAGPLSSSAADPNHIPAELLPANGRDFVTSIPLYLMAFANLVLIARIVESRGRARLPVPSAAAALFGLLFTMAFFWMKRAMEYAAPFTALGFIGLMDSVMRDDVPFPILKLHWKKAAWGLMALSVILGCISTACYAARGNGFRERPRLRQYLETNFAPGTAVLNADWSDFPQLYFEAPQLRWQWGLDPAFSRAENERKTKLLTATIPAARLAAETGLKHVVLLYPRISRAKHLESCGWRLVEDIPGEAWIFSAQE